MKKNDKVVCVDDNFCEEQRKRIPNLLVKDKIYTLSCDPFPTSRGYAVFVKEITNPKLPEGTGENGYTFEPCWSIFRLRLLDEFDLQSELSEIEELELV